MLAYLCCPMVMTSVVHMTIAPHVHVAAWALRLHKHQTPPAGMAVHPCVATLPRGWGVISGQELRWEMWKRDRGDRSVRRMWMRFPDKWP